MPASPSRRMNVGRIGVSVRKCRSAMLFGRARDVPEERHETPSRRAAF